MNTTSIRGLSSSASSAAITWHMDDYKMYPSVYMGKNGYEKSETKTSNILFSVAEEGRGITMLTGMELLKRYGQDKARRMIVDYCEKTGTKFTRPELKSITISLPDQCKH